MEKIKIKCFHCGKVKDITINRPICFGFELLELAKEVDMLGVIDNNYGRTIVFCNEDCLNAELTKKGTIRLRAVGV